MPVHLVDAQFSRVHEGYPHTSYPLLTTHICCSPKPSSTPLPLLLLPFWSPAPGPLRNHFTTLLSSLPPISSYLLVAAAPRLIPSTSATRDPLHSCYQATTISIPHAPAGCNEVLASVLEGLGSLQRQNPNTMAINKTPGASQVTAQAEIEAPEPTVPGLLYHSP